MKVFTDTNYREHGAGDLVEYLDKEDGLRNRLGEQMTDEEIQAFIEKSDEYDFERQIIISPADGDQLSDRALSHHTRQVMSEFCTDRPTATYCYAIHRDTDHPHTQVAVTGTKRDLWMDREDCLELRELATEQFHEQHNELTAELSHRLEAEFDRDLDDELAPDLEPGDGHQAPTHHAPDRGADQPDAEQSAAADALGGEQARDPAAEQTPAASDDGDHGVEREQR